MRKHELDLTSLVAGVVLLAIAVSYFVGSVIGSHLDARLVLPLGLVGLGVAGLAGSLARARRRLPEAAVAGTDEAAREDGALP